MLSRTIYAGIQDVNSRVQKKISRLLNGKVLRTRRIVNIPFRYDAVLSDMKIIGAKEFEEASSKRFKVERAPVRELRNTRYRYNCVLSIHMFGYIDKIKVKLLNNHTVPEKQMLSCD